MNQKIKKSELKKFSLIWACLFLGIGIYPIYKGDAMLNFSLAKDLVRIWFVVISGIFLSIAFIKPEILKPFYRLWVKVGEFIGGIISKIIMFILYFGIFTPISFGLKVFGKDLLGKRMDKAASTYWITRDTQPQPMKNQF